MANLITYEYFVNDPLKIPNISGTGTIPEALQAAVTRYITQYEKKFLRRLLGDDLYDAMIANTAPTPRWVTLKAQLVNSTDKISPIANYVWYYYQKQNQVVITQSGDKKTSEANMSALINGGKYMEVWNQMVSDAEDFYDWLEDNAATYPEWEGDAFDFETINGFDI